MSGMTKGRAVAWTARPLQLALSGELRRSRAGGHQLLPGAGTADADVDGAEERPRAGDAEADVRLVLRVGVADDVEVEDRAEHRDVGEKAEHGDDPVLQEA